MSGSPLERSRGRFVRNLVKVYHAASPAAHTLGRTWYLEARRIVAEWSVTYALPPATVACVIAALSPQCEWTRNLIIADDILADRAVSVGGALQANIRKARAILAERPTSPNVMLVHFPGGPKVNSFAWNLLGDDGIVTVDTHALQAAFNDVRSTRTLKWAAYGVLARAYATAALQVGEDNAPFQAIVWHAWKERYPKGVKNHLRRKDRRHA